MAEQQRKSERHSNKLFQVLGIFSPQECRKLLRFLDSPYFNQSRTLSRLCASLLEAHEHGASGFDRHEVWRELFPDTPYEDVNFRKYCSDALKLVEGFMAMENLQLNPIRQSLELLEFSIQRNVVPIHNSALRQARNELDRHAQHSVSHFYQSYAVERQYYAMMDFDVRLNVKANLEAISNNLDLFYWIEKLKLFSAVISQRKTGTHQYELRFIEPILDYLAHFPVESVPELALYYYSFLTLYEEENTGHYHNFRRILDEYADRLAPQEAVELYDSALHYCTGKLNRGDRIFMQEYFDIFRDGLQRGIFLQNGELAPWRFNNAVGVALGLGKFDWAEQFIGQYHTALPAGTRKNTHAFNLARVYRFQGKYKEVLELLRDLEYEDIGYNLLAKRMVIMTYYDLDEYDALDSFMESFRVFLNRHKNIAQQRRQSYLNWLKYVRRLTRLIPGDKSAVGNLREEVLRNKAAIANHEWLLEKLDELA